jgi:hypothetical protein
MTTIRDHCAAQVNDVAYLLECIRDGSSDPITLQEIADRANTARAALAAEPAGDVPSERDVAEWINSLPLWHGASRDELSGIVLRALARWGRPATPPAPEVGEVVELVAALMEPGDPFPEYRTITCEQADRAATLLQQLSAPAPAVVPVAVAERLPDPRPESEGGDCDAEGRCWAFMPRSATPFPNWTLLWIGHMQPYHSHWRPASAIPLPQVGEVEG